jgi:hypothetical protein
MGFNVSMACCEYIPVTVLRCVLAEDALYCVYSLNPFVHPSVFYVNAHIYMYVNLIGVMCLLSMLRVLWYHPAHSTTHTHTPAIINIADTRTRP